MSLVLERQRNCDNSVIGTLYLNGDKLCNTLELPWDANKRGVSCIPNGVYDLETHRWKGRFPTFCLVNNSVGITHYKRKGNRRDTILMHVGNTPEDTDGCILLGEETERSDYIAHSKEAFTHAIKRIKESGETTLVIL